MPNVNSGSIFVPVNRRLRSFFLCVIKLLQTLACVLDRTFVSASVSQLLRRFQGNYSARTHSKQHWNRQVCQFIHKLMIPFPSMPNTAHPNHLYRGERHVKVQRNPSWIYVLCPSGNSGGGGGGISNYTKVL
jgi:hypothetical protein